MDLLLSAFGFVLGILVPHWVLRWDERRLSVEGRRRAWNDASHWSAVVAFSFLCLPVHFVKTRRSLRGFLLGLGAMALALLTSFGLLHAVAFVFDG